MKNCFANKGMDPSMVDEVILGQTKQSAHAPNIARVASLIAGIPEEVSAYTVHRQCGSGMQAVLESYMMIKTGNPIMGIRSVRCLIEN